MRKHYPDLMLQKQKRSLCRWDTEGINALQAQAIGNVTKEALLSPGQQKHDQEPERRLRPAKSLRPARRLSTRLKTLDTPQQKNIKIARKP